MWSSGTSTSPERRSTSVYHRFMHTAHDAYMSKVTPYLRPAAYQSGMYIRSRMSSRLVLNVVYVHVCQRLTSSLTSLNIVATEIMRNTYVYDYVNDLLMRLLSYYSIIINKHNKTSSLALLVIIYKHLFLLLVSEFYAFSAWFIARTALNTNLRLILTYRYLCHFGHALTGHDMS